MIDAKVAEQVKQQLTNPTTKQMNELQKWQEGLYNKQLDSVLQYKITCKKWHAN